MTQQAGGDVPPAPSQHNVLVYSDDARVREAVRMAVGTWPSADLGRVVFLEAATQQEVIDRVDAGDADLLVLDGEAKPSGGLGLCRQLKYEVGNCPPVLVVLARADDRWLATWSRADRYVFHPIDAVEVSAVVVDMLRAQHGART